MGLKDQIDCLLGNDESRELFFSSVDLEKDGLVFEEKSQDFDPATEVSFNSVLKNIAEEKDYQQQFQCQVCCQRLVLGQLVLEKLPSMKPVV